jgi:hypothetical protein
VTDDDFLSSNAELQALIEHCKRWARTWQDEPPLKGLSLHAGVRCSELLTQSFTVDLVETVKPVYILQRLLERYGVKEVETAGAGPWVEAAAFLSRRRNLPVAGADEAAAGPRRASRGTGFAKAAFAELNRRLRPPRRGAVLYSSAMRYARPLIGKSGGLYLRDTFSVQAFRQSLGRAFEHVLPRYFEDRGDPSRRAEAADAFFRAADAWFSENAFFEWKGEDLWPLVRKRASALVEAEMKPGMALVDRFGAMFERTSPSAVVVDEEVCFFNKTLVLAANARGIPTFVLVHGDPYDDVGSLPSSASRLLAWGPCTARRFADWGVPGARIVETGAPQFSGFDARTAARERAAIGRRHRIRDGAPVALYAAFAFATNERATFLRPSFGEKMQRRGLAAALAALERHPSLHLVVKFHPYEEHEALSREQVSEAGPQVAARVHFERRYDATTSMYAEALLWGKPALAFHEKSYPFSPSGPQWLVDMDDAAACAAAIDACLDPARAAEVRARIEAMAARYFSEANRAAAARALAAVRGAAVPAREEASRV